MTAPPKKATVIMIPKQLRAEWMDVMSLDVRLSNFAFRLGCVVGTYLNNYSGDTFVSQDTIAKVMAVKSSRTVWGGFRELESFGYLLVKRGTAALPPNRKRRSGGQGVANVYVPAFDNSQISAGYRSEKFAKYCGLIWDAHLLNTQNQEAKSAKNCAPTLSSPSEKNSAPSTGPSSPDGLGPVGALLQQRLGDDVFRSWFGKVTVGSVVDGVATLIAPTAFIRDRIINDHGHILQPVWQAIDPAVIRVNVITGGVSQ